MGLSAGQRALGARLAAYALVAVLSIVTSGVILRALGVVAAGSYFSATAVALIAYSISDQNLASVALRDVGSASRTDAERTVLLRSIIAFRLMSWSIAWCLVFAVLALPLQLDHVWSASLLIYVWIVLLIATGTMQVPAQSAMRQGRTSLLLVLQAVLSLGSAAGLSLGSAPNWTYFGVQIPGLLVAAAILAKDSEARSTLIPDVHLSAVMSLARANFVLGAATVCAVVSNRISPALVLGFGGAKAAGEYGAGFRLADAIESVAPLLMTVLLPTLARSAESDGSELAARLVSLSYRMLPLGLVCGGLLGVWGGSALGYIGGSQYAGLHDLFHGLGAFVLLAFVVQPINYVLLASVRNRALLASSAGAAVTLLAATPPLSAEFGAAGAAAATALSFAVLGAISAFAVRRLVSRRIWQRYLCVAVSSIAVAIVIFNLNHRVIATIFVLLAAMASHLAGMREGRQTDGPTG